MMNALHAHDRQLNQHQTSIMASLSHRLEVAKATNNLRLAVLLEQERHQLGLEQSSSSVQSHVTWWQTLRQQVAEILFGGSSLQAHEVIDGRDCWWVASDPRTGQMVYADSEAEMRLWIKANYQGR